MLGTVFSITQLFMHSPIYLGVYLYDKRSTQYQIWPYIKMKKWVVILLQTGAMETLLLAVDSYYDFQDA